MILVFTEIQRFEIVENESVQELIFSDEGKSGEISFKVRIPSGLNKTGIIMFPV